MYSNEIAEQVRNDVMLSVSETSHNILGFFAIAQNDDTVLLFYCLIVLLPLLTTIQQFTSLRRMPQSQNRICNAIPCQARNDERKLLRYQA